MVTPQTMPTSSTSSAEGISDSIGQRGDRLDLTCSSSRKKPKHESPMQKLRGLICVNCSKNEASFLYEFTPSRFPPHSVPICSSPRMQALADMNPVSTAREVRLSKKPTR